MAEKLPTKPGRELVPPHRRNVPSTLSRVDPLTGRPRFPGELPLSTAMPVDPMSAAFGYPVGASPFQKPSDLLFQKREPSVEEIRSVLRDHKHLLTEQSLPLTENTMRMADAARRKYGNEALAWGENWEEAGKELGFETDAELRTLINDIYAVQERETRDVRDEFWALEGPAFERTVQNILEKRSERESYIPDEVISLLHTGAKQNREPGEFIGTLIERGLVPETARDAANKHFEDGIWLRDQGGKAAGGFIDKPLYDRAV